MRFINKLRSSVFYLLTVFFCRAQENTLLWEVKGNGLKKSSYLYGTYHSKDARAHEFGDSVFKKLNATNMVVLENTDAKTMFTKGDLSFCMMKNEKLENLVSAEDYKLIKTNAIKYIGMTGVLFNTMKPLFTVVVAGLNGQRQEKKDLVDDYIKKEGIKRGKKIYALESAKDALAAMDSIPLKDQAEMLVDLFKKKASYNQQSDSLIELYREQKLIAMYEFYVNCNSPETFDKRLIKERNLKFATKIMSLLKQQQSVFCAVGALHLPGKGGLIELLRASGYSVTPIFNKHTPKPLKIKDQRKWGYYGNDSLLIDVQFPYNPTFESSGSDSSEYKRYTYECRDVLYKLDYFVSIFSFKDSSLIRDPLAFCEDVSRDMQTSNKWIKVQDLNTKIDGLIAKELEFNISSGVNTRMKFIANGRKLYILGISGYKDSLYSPVAERFFKENTILHPKVFLTINVSDSKTNLPIQEFTARITSANAETRLQFKKGEVPRLELPQTPDVYTIRIEVKDYIHKLFQVNTHDISKVGQALFEGEANATLIKSTEASEKVKNFTKPYAILRLLNADTFNWDLNYINRVKQELAD